VLLEAGELRLREWETREVHPEARGTEWHLAPEVRGEEQEQESAKVVVAVAEEAQDCLHPQSSIDPKSHPHHWMQTG
jgi:hypothetical protein